MEDVVQIRATLAMTALAEGRRDEAARMTDDLEALASQGTYGEVLSAAAARAELALADGDIAGGLRRYRETARVLRNLRVPGAPEGSTLWTILGEVIALSAFAQYGEGDDGADLFEALRAEVLVVFDPDRAFPDLPAMGMVLAGLGIWGLLKGAMPAEEAVRMLVLADRFAYNRFTPTMRWPVLAAHAERVAPGVISRIEAGYGARRGPDLLAEAHAVLERVV